MPRLLLVAAFVAALAVPVGAQSLIQYEAAPVELVTTARQCGAQVGDPVAAARADAYAQSVDPSASSFAAVQIPVAFHVVSNSAGTEGNIPTSQINSQINVLNAAFSGSGYSFYLASVDRTRNSTWFAAGINSSAEVNMKASLARSPRTTLNLYSIKPGGSTLGWATFPWQYAETSTRHGVVLHYGTLPGGGLAPFNLGDTGTHEVGHYLGLYHTFQGGCSGSGDYVSDTPPEASPAGGCPGGRDTCPSGGLDPIQNYMDYTDDACMDRFTNGQRSRMTSLTSYYRPGLGGGSAFAETETGASRVDGVAPNPFSQTTSIRYTLAEADVVTLRVYDVLGREVAVLVDGAREAGAHVAVFDGTALPSGTYVYRLQTGVSVETGRMTLSR